MKKIFIILMVAGLSMAYTVDAQVTTINGLTVVIDFTDAKIGATNTEISAMLNQVSGFNQWGNIGSVRQFFDIQSNGKILLNSQVVRVSLAHNQDYYNSSGSYDGGQQLLMDAVNAINIQNPGGFNGLTVHPTDNRLWYFLMIKAGAVTGVSYWAVSSLSVRNNSLPLPVKNVALVGYGGSNPSISVICHEFGHHLFGWTDYYNTTGYQSTNLGHYCLMGSGGSSTTPMPVNPILRRLSGWIPDVVELKGEETRVLTIRSNSPSPAYRYVNPFNSKEYYMIEALAHGGYYCGIDVDGYETDQGLAIWYVDEEAGMDKPMSVPYPRIKLVQADGHDEMHDPAKTHREWRGDLDDLFDNVHPEFNSGLYPGFTWRDGSETGLFLTDISAPGATMTVTVRGRDNTITAIPYSNGNIRPKGLINVPDGGSQSFDILPAVGFEVREVYVNDELVGAPSRYTFEHVSGDQTLLATFRPVTTLMPDGWTAVDIGTLVSPTKSDYRDGVFRFDTRSANIGALHDNFHLVSRPLTGNGEIVAHIASATKPQEGSLAGIILRESTADNSRFFMVARTVRYGIAMRYRETAGVESSQSNNAGIWNFDWLKIKREGSLFSAYYSADGITWTEFISRTLTMSSQVLAGLCADGSTANMSLVVNFDRVGVSGESYPILAEANPPTGGTITGAGSYLYGSAVTLTAAAANGYTFSGWTEEGQPASAEEGLSFIARSWRRLVANFSGGTGTGPVPLDATLALFPNPGRDRFTLRIDNGVRGDLRIRVLSSAGSLLDEFNLFKQPGGLSVPLVLTGQPPGVYLVDVQCAGQNALLKLVLSEIP